MSDELTDAEIVELFESIEPVEFTDAEIERAMQMLSTRALLATLHQAHAAMLGVLNDNSRFVSLEVQRQRHEERMAAMRAAVIEIKRTFNLCGQEAQLE